MFRDEGDGSNDKTTWRSGVRGIFQEGKQPLKNVTPATRHGWMVPGRHRVASLYNDQGPSPIVFHKQLSKDPELGTKVMPKSFFRPHKSHSAYLLQR